MRLKCTITIPNTVSPQDISSGRALSVIEKQLKEQGRCAPNTYGYRVRVEFPHSLELSAPAAREIAEALVNAVARTKLLWSSTDQVEKLVCGRAPAEGSSESRILVDVRGSGENPSGVPNYLRASCKEASEGGTTGYSGPGFNLAIHLFEEQPYDISNEEWAQSVENMCSLLRDSEVTLVWKWFCEYLPECMSLVPRRRMEQFVQGVTAAYEDGRIG